jgi:phospholipid/cholesterol/gamma-HCH transport system substrate-binding protein
MKDANRNYIAVGAFVLSMLAMLILWIAVLLGSATSTDSYYVLWDNVMGLKPGTQILFEGYQIGLIDSIEKSDGAHTGGKNYRVDIEVEEGWPIPEGSIAQTASPTVLAALIVNIEAGGSRELISPGSEIEGKETEDLFEAAEDVMKTVADLVEFVKPVLEEITKSVGAVLNDENAAQISALLETLNTRISEIQSARNAGNIESILANLNQVSEDVSELTIGLKETKGEIDGVLAAVDTLMDERSGDIGHALGDLHASLETVSRHIDSIAINLDNTTRNANEFSSQIRENPGVLLRGREVADDSRPVR